jgi:uncharacterized protein YdeI (YjbR/CyaY-like superfamily)
MPSKPQFFATSSDMRRWFERNAAKSEELIVGFYKKHSGKPSVTWPESVDVALCFGWIDGVRKRLDENSYTIRFTPRRSGSIWSDANLKRARELIASGLMHPAGLKAFEARLEARTAIYSYEQRKTAELDPASKKRFQAHPKAWAFFEAQAPSYRRITAWWVISAKQEKTRTRRLDQLIETSEKARVIDLLKPRSPKENRD